MEPVSGLDRPTSGHSCALAVAIPLCRDEFIADYGSEDDDPKDFARFVTGGDKPEIGWEKRGSILADMAVQLILAAGRCGAMVVPRARVTDLASLFSATNDYVTVVAHWRGAGLRARDIMCDPDEVVARIASAAGASAPAATVEALLASIEPEMPRIRENPDAGERRAFFAAMLNRNVIALDHVLPGLLPPAGVATTVVSELWVQTWHRDLLDVCAGGLIRPGNQLELRDGLHNPRAVASHVADDWAGHVDLTVCNSAVLGHIIKGARHDRRFILRKNPVELIVNLTVLSTLYSDLAVGKYNYTRRLIELFQEMMRFLQSVPHEDLVSRVLRFYQERRS